MGSSLTPQEWADVAERKRTQQAEYEKAGDKEAAAGAKYIAEDFEKRAGKK